MHVEVFHATRPGTPVVFVHGAMVAGWMWTEQVAQLDDRPCAVIDLPGMGQSADLRWTDFAGAADAIAEVCAARWPEGVHVVGLSLGGIVSLHLATRHPGLVRSLVVSGVPHGRLGAGFRLLNRTLLWLYARPWGARLVARAFGMPDAETIDAFVHTAGQTDLAALRAVHAELDAHPIPPNVEEITAPTLAVVGTKDSPLSKAGLARLAAVPGVTACDVEGVGHQWNAEAPALFTEMVRQWIDLGTPHAGLTVR